MVSAKSIVRQTRPAKKAQRPPLSRSENMARIRSKGTRPEACVGRLLFAEGLAEEMKPYGIRVCALCPGSTESEFHAASGQEKFQRRVETAEKVAHTGLKALAAGKSYIISGLGNYLGAHGERLVPRRFVTRMAGKMFKPGTK